MKMTTKTKKTPKTADKAKTHKVGADRKAIGAIKPSGQGKDTKALPQKPAIGPGNPNIVSAGKETQFKPGNMANPGGKPVGARNRLQGDFLRELSEDFAENGRTAIIDCRTNKPDVYIKVVASLMPKELEIKRPLEELSDDELASLVDTLRSSLEVKAHPPANAVRH